LHGNIGHIQGVFDGVEIKRNLDFAAHH
jgi:hypothetical protein